VKQQMSYTDTRSFDDEEMKKVIFFIFQGRKLLSCLKMFEAYGQKKLPKII